MNLSTVVIIVLFIGLTGVWTGSGTIDAVSNMADQRADKIEQAMKAAGV